MRSALQKAREAPSSTKARILATAEEVFAGLSPDGLPVGLQLVATTATGNARLLRIARWMEELLDPLPAVPTGITHD